jgi:hypothetical protein
MYVPICDLFWINHIISPLIPDIGLEQDLWHFGSKHVNDKDADVAYSMTAANSDPLDNYNKGSFLYSAFTFIWTISFVSISLVYVSTTSRGNWTIPQRECISSNL